MRIQGNMQSQPYISTRNGDVMREYIVAHYCVNEMRNQALLNNQIGPRVLVTGSNLCGKSSFCHMLLNYSLKLGWTPIYCDLDLENEISIPGSIAATVVDYIVPNDFMIDNSIILYNGNTKNDFNYYLYESQITELASICQEKLQYDLAQWKKKTNIGKDNYNTKESFINCEHPTLYSSGIIIHCPLIETMISKDKNIYNTIIKEFDINLVYVIENEKLSNDIMNLCDKQGKKISILLLSKITGINEDLAYKEYLEQQRFNEYLKGPFMNFKISELKVNLSTYKLLQVTSSNVSSSVLPIGQSSDLNLLVREVTIDEDNLLHKIIAIIALDEKIITDLDVNFDKKLNDYVDLFSKAPVNFFGIINKVDKKGNCITVCSPCIQLTHKYLLIGNIKYSNL